MPEQHSQESFRHWEKQLQTSRPQSRTGCKLASRDSTRCTPLCAKALTEPRSAERSLASMLARALKLVFKPSLWQPVRPPKENFKILKMPVTILHWYKEIHATWWARKGEIVSFYRSRLSSCVCWLVLLEQWTLVRWESGIETLGYSLRREVKQFSHSWRIPDRWLPTAAGYPALPRRGTARGEWRNCTELAGWAPTPKFPPSSWAQSWMTFPSLSYSYNPTNPQRLCQAFSRYWPCCSYLHKKVFVCSNGPSHSWVLLA